MIRLRVHGAVVERIPAAHHAQESRRLLVGFGTQTRHFQQAFPVFEIAVRGAVCDDVFGQRRPQTGYVGQNMLRCGVDVHADLVHAALDHRDQSGPELGLIDAVLVLSDADRLRVDLHQLRQRVHQPAADADRAANGHVVIGELFAGRGRRRVDRCAVLAHHEHPDALQPQPADQLFGLAPCRAVAYGEGFGLVPGRQRPQRFGGFVVTVLRRMGIDGGVMQQVALRIEHHDFAARAESGVDGDDALLSERRREQQLPQVFGEYPDRFVVGLLLGRRQQFGLDRGPDQPLERVCDGSFHPFARRRAVAYELAAKPFRNAVGVHLHRDL